MMPFSPLWVGVALGGLLLAAPQLLLRSASGLPLFGGHDDVHIMRMGRICGLAIIVIFLALLGASEIKGA